MLVKVFYIGYGSRQVKKGWYECEIVPERDRKFGAITGHIYAPKAKEPMYFYLWNKKKYDYPVLFYYKSRKYLRPQDNLNDYQMADLCIARLIINSYLERIKAEMGQQMEMLFNSVFEDNNEPELRFRDSHKEVRPSPVHLASIPADIRFKPYPSNISIDHTSSRTPEWFMDSYKVLHPCYKRTANGTQYALDYEGHKIWLYDRHTKINDQDKDIAEEGERVLKQVVHKYCNKCEYVAFCSKQPCVDVKDIVDKKEVVHV